MRVVSLREVLVPVSVADSLDVVAVKDRVVRTDEVQSIGVEVVVTFTRVETAVQLLFAPSPLVVVVPFTAGVVVVGPNTGGAELTAPTTEQLTVDTT